MVVTTHQVRIVAVRADGAVAELGRRRRIETRAEGGALNILKRHLPKELR
eukprot:SAG11_NODE_4416_length_1905_cov_1.266888_4_plen_50_part_00